MVRDMSQGKKIENTFPESTAQKKLPEVTSRKLVWPN